MSIRGRCPEANRVIDGISQARIDLLKGFLDIVLSADQQSPFRHEEGIALIDQAIVTLEESGKRGISGEAAPLGEELSWGDIEKKATAFRSDLDAWVRATDDQRGSLELQLKVEFHELGLYADQIDMANKVALDHLDDRANFRFTVTISISALLLAGICLGVFRAGRNQALAVKALQGREEQLRTVGDNLPSGYIYRLRRAAEGKLDFTYISAGVQRVHGVTAQECVRDSNALFCLMAPGQLETFNAAEERSAQTLGEVALDLRFRKTGSPDRIVHIRSTPSRDERGSITWDGLVVDVTEARQAEETIRNNQSLLQEMGSTAKVGGWEFDVATGEGEWTEEVARIHDLEAHDKTSMILGLSFFCDKSRTRIEAAIKETIENGTPYDLELELISAKGAHKWVHTIGRPVYEGGKLVRLRGSIQDITHLKEVEIALRHREQQVRLYIEHSPAAMAVLDTDMRYLAVSRRWLSDFNLIEANIIGRSHYEVFPEIPECWKEVHQRCLAGAVEKNDADSFVRADGSTEWLRWETVPWRREDGMVGGLILFSEMITRQKKAEEALRRQQNNYQTIFNATNDAIFLHDATTGQLLDVNEAMARMFGYSTRAEAILLKQESPFSGEAPHDSQEAHRRIRLADEQGPQVFEWIACRKNGEKFWVEVSLSATDIDDHRCVLAVVRDISERKAHELEIGRLNRLYSTLSQVNQVIVRCQTKEELFGEICRVMIEYGQMQCVAIGWRNIQDGSWAIVQQRGRVPGNEDILRAWAENRDIGPEMVRTSAPVICNQFIPQPQCACSNVVDHGIRAFAAFPVRLRGGICGAFGIGSGEEEFFKAEEVRLLQEISDDISFALGRMDEQEQKLQVEDQFRQAQKLEGIGQLAGGVAHDFNNILAAIMMQAQLTEASGEIPESVAQEMLEIQRACERGSNLTRQLLLFSRKQAMQRQDIDLNESVRNITKMLRRIIGENVSIRLYLHNHPLWTHADAGMLDQVLLNLAINARDAMGLHGILTIESYEKEIDEQRARINPDARPGRYVCLAVSDTGCGISPDVLPHIFEPFFTTKVQGKGTGLGLATVFGIVKQHEGWIEVRTEIGTGTTFEIFLPATVDTSQRAISIGMSARQFNGSETILLAEDDFSVRKITTRLLESKGYKVIEAINGKEALVLWRQWNGGVDMLLTDLLMPDGLNGRDLASELLAENPGLKVIFLSGYSADVFGPDEELRAGENFLQKPYSANQLLELVRRQFDS